MCHKMRCYKGLIQITAIVLLLFFLPLNSRVQAQCNSGTTLGDDFWVMFLRNYTDSANLSLIAAGNSNAVVTVENPRLNWRTTANLTAGGYVVIPIPFNMMRTNFYDSVLNAGLHVYSTADISLYASNFKAHSYDITTVLPTTTLNTRYIFQEYAQGIPEFGVLATEDNTVIIMAGLDTVRLMRGQTYQKIYYVNPTGVEVYSNNKPFAMFQGNNCTYVPDTFCCCDHLYEQSIPVDYWGNNFVVAPSQVRLGAAGAVPNAGDLIRITSSQDSCDVFIDSVLVDSNLMKGNVYEAIVPYSMINRIYTTKPSMVCLYMSSCNYGGQPGDPSTVIIPPIEQGVCEVAFAAYNTSAITRHYMNIVVATSDLAGMMMDSNIIASYFSPIDSVYSFAQISVQAGVHTLQNQMGDFVAYFYGLGRAESYAYTAGMGLRNIREGLQINHRSVRTAEDTVSHCITDTANIRLITNALDTSVLWYLDDTLLNVSRLSFKHHFNNVGTYRITAVTHGHCDTLWCDTLEGVVRVVAPGMDTVRIPICPNETFNYRGTNYTGMGVYEHYYPTGGVCDSMMVLVTYLRDTLRDTVDRSICVGGTYIFNGDSLSTPGFYRSTLRTHHGCDSVAYLILTLNDTLRDTVRRTICDLGHFDTNGIAYHQRGFYTQYLRDTLTGCYHNLVIDLTVMDTIYDTVHPVICAGASFDSNGVSYTAKGVYKQYMRTADSCFHQLVIDLAVNDTLRDTIHPVICIGASFDTNGHLGYSPVSGHDYPPYTQQGVYTQYLRDTVTGCFFDLVIDLTVNDTILDTIHPVICAGASFDTGGVSYYNQGFYSQLIPDLGGCLHRLYIDLTVNDTLRDTVHPVICAGTSFDTGGVSYYNPGFYTQVTRDLGGCYHIHSIDLTVNDTLRDTIYRTICAGSSFDTGGVSYYSPGFHTQVVRDLGGCLHRLYIDLTVNDTLRDTIYPTICAGASFDTGGRRYYMPGQYTQHLRQPDSCYNNLVINISVQDTLRDTMRYLSCPGETLDTNRHMGCVPVSGVDYPPYELSGIYTQYLRDTATGCFRNFVIQLIVPDTNRIYIHPVICADETFNYKGQSYNRTGYYKYLWRDSVSRCYNILNIDLAVHDTFRDVIQQNLCAGNTYTHGGQTYSIQGTYLQRLHTVYGCDSIIEIHINVSDTLRDTVEYALCAGQTIGLNGQTYAYRGWYRQNFRTANGCDSILHIHISVSDTLRDTLSYSICAGQTVEVNGQSYANRGWYRQKLHTSDGCDSILGIHIAVSDTIRDTLYYYVCAGKNIEINGLPYNTQGWYRQDLHTVDGCDSIVHLFITVDTALNLKASFKMKPLVISLQNMQMKFSDYSTGNVFDRKWIFHEIPPVFFDKEVPHERFTYYTPHYESDSLQVTLVVQNENGCDDTASDTYPIVKGSVWVPNAFTPDADQNRLLKVGYDNIATYEIFIYNRRGLLVYHSTDIGECWDGKHKGKPCPAATYVYRIHYTTKSRPNDSNEKSGTVLLIR